MFPRRQQRSGQYWQQEGHQRQQQACLPKNHFLTQTHDRPSKIFKLYLIRALNSLLCFVIRHTESAFRHHRRRKPNNGAANRVKNEQRCQDFVRITEVAGQAAAGASSPWRPFFPAKELGNFVRIISERPWRGPPASCVSHSTTPGRRRQEFKAGGSVAHPPQAPQPR